MKYVRLFAFFKKEPGAVVGVPVLEKNVQRFVCDRVLVDALLGYIIAALASLAYSGTSLLAVIAISALLIFAAVIELSLLVIFLLLNSFSNFIPVE
jgi:hypothetical protein